MANLKEFRAYLYSSELKNQMQELLSPPYDVIKDSERKNFIQKNAHNSVQLCLVDDPEDSDRYKKMKAVWTKWKADHIVQQAEKPSLYLIEDRFQLNGKEQIRLGFIGLLETSPFEEKQVFPHEHTLAGPKKDRLDLLKEMGAELSQIFFVYDDSDRVLEKIYEKRSTQSPSVDCLDQSQIHRRMWLMDDPEEIASLKKVIQQSPLLIADGHHRYETALHYAKETKGSEEENKGRYVQSYFTNRRNPNFLILPIHRVCSLPDGQTEKDLLNFLKGRFQVEKLGELPESLPQHQDRLQYVLSLSQEASHYLVSRPKKSDQDAEVFSLQTEIFQDYFHWDLTKVAKGFIAFEHTKENFLSALKEKERAIGFYLPPTDLDVIMKVTQEENRMPQKSTFFYPKLASGLVIYELGNL